MRLRALAVSRLAEDGSGLPGHIAEKIDDRMHRDRRKGLLDDSDATPMNQMAQYLDLRELEDVFVAKANWPHFESIFASKA